MKEVGFAQLVSAGCGIVVHRNHIVASIRKNSDEVTSYAFGTSTKSLKSLREWCRRERVTHVAIEGSGIYWRPLFAILEEEFEVILVNMRHLKNVPGHRVGGNDTRWLSKLLLSGLLKSSFIPPRNVRELRDWVRCRKNVAEQMECDRRRVFKIFDDANIKLNRVLSTVDEAAGIKIFTDLLNGETSAAKLLEHCHDEPDAEEFCKALEGNVNEHHKQMLAFYRDSMADRQRRLQQLDAAIERAAEAFESVTDLLQTIPGVNRESAISIVGEIGTDMSQFPDAIHLCSWVGTTPDDGDTVRKRRTKTAPGNCYLQDTLSECALEAITKDEGHFRRKYESWVVRHGRKKAQAAVAREIIIAVYRVIRDREAWCDPGFESSCEEVEEWAIDN